MLDANHINPSNYPGFKQYVKKHFLISAVQMDESFDVGEYEGNPGDYLVIGSTGKGHPVERVFFKNNYISMEPITEILQQETMPERLSITGTYDTDYDLIENAWDIIESARNLLCGIYEDEIRWHDIAIQWQNKYADLKRVMDKQKSIKGAQ